MQTGSKLSSLLSAELLLDSTQMSRLNRLNKGLQRSNCVKCRLHKDRPPGVSPVPGEGKGKVMFVGHRIGANEENKGQPAIGRYSRYGFSLFLESLLRYTKKDLDIDKANARELVLDYAYVTNTARCGGDEDVKVNASCWNRCAPAWLRQEYNIIKPEIVVFWNRETAKSCLKEEPPQIGTIETKTMFGREVPVMVMNHPAVIGREESYKPVIQSQFDILTDWMRDNDLIIGDGGELEAYTNPVDIPAEHIYIDNYEDLELALADLKKYKWLGLDTETGFSASIDERTAYEKTNGALSWYAEGFDLVTVQLAGLEKDGSVRKTYTIACGFRNPFTHEPRQTLTAVDICKALDLFFTDPYINERGEPDKHIVCLWNAGFDAPVLTRYGFDLWGVSSINKYNMTLIDGMLVLGRLNEHYVDIQQLSLDAASKIYLGVGKGGGFSKHFDVETFPFLDVTDTNTLQDILNYTGEDPRKTLLTTRAILADLENHTRNELEIEFKESSLPKLGFGPYIRPTKEAGPKLENVCIPMDHQMLPVITGMEMIGFKFSKDKFEHVRKYVKTTKRELEKLIRKEYSWYKPNSSAHAGKVIDEMFENIVDAINNISKIDKHQAYAMCADALDPLKEERGKDNQPVGKLSKAVAAFFYKQEEQTQAAYKDQIDIIRKAFETTYGEITSEQPMIEDKILPYYEYLDNLTDKDLQSQYYQDFFKKVFFYKQIHKKWSTYFVRFHDILDRDNIIHPSYGQRTVSGRFQGNFQNIPRGGKEGLSWLKKLVQILNKKEYDALKTDEEREEYINSKDLLDVRQYIFAPSAEDINRILARFPYLGKLDKPWKVNPDDEYVIVSADFAAQEDRMAYALSGDVTKRRLLDNSELDLHFYNAAFCFGVIEGFDTSTEEGVMAAYEHMISDPRFEDIYRTPMKTVHYASTFGAQTNKLHLLLAPVFSKMGKPWSYEDTKNLKERYDNLYEGVTTFRNDLIDRLDRDPYVEFPIYGTIRHAKLDPLKGNEVVQSEYLSVANALNQGTSAYITKTAMLRMRHLIEANAERWNLVQVGGDCYVNIILQVHDEIGVICPAHLAKEVSLCLESAMKIIVGPPTIEHGLDPHWNDTIKDHRNETGWLYIPDEFFKGEVLFDADAEVKKTIAKTKILFDGTVNKYASLDEPETFDNLPDSPHRLNQSYKLLLGRKDHINTIL